MTSTSTSGWPRRRRCAITHVTETHIHADFVSGSRELAARTGAALYLSAEGGKDWQYAFAREAGAVLLRDGDHIMVGNVRIDVVHTPGHTPEHLAFLVTDTAAATEPIAIVTGDFVFVGDVGRPDLLEKAAKVQGTMEASARTLSGRSQRFKAYPDYLQVWPGHGAGSACGKGLSAVPQSTVGYERRFNWALAVETEDEFVRQVLTGQPEPPAYFAEMKRINRDGPRILNGFATPQWLPEVRLPEVLARGAFVIDARPAAEFAAGHVPGTINIPLNRSFTTWAGWLTPFDDDFYLIVDDSGSDRGAHNVNRGGEGPRHDRARPFRGLLRCRRGERMEPGRSRTAHRSADLGRRAGDPARGRAVAVIDVRGRPNGKRDTFPGCRTFRLASWSSNSLRCRATGRWWSIARGDRVRRSPRAYSRLTGSPGWRTFRRGSRSGCRPGFPWNRSPMRWRRRPERERRDGGPGPGNYLIDAMSITKRYFTSLFNIRS